MSTENIQLLDVADSLLESIRDGGDFQNAITEAFTALFPNIAIAIKAVEDSMFTPSNSDEVRAGSIPMFSNNTWHLITVTHSSVNISNTAVCFGHYIATLLSLRNEQSVSNRLSTLLNNEIDNHHKTGKALQRERSARVGFERELADYSRKMTEAIVETQEMERRRFARDLHDGIGNTLSMVKLMVSSLRDDHQHDREDEELFKRVLVLLDSAVTESRQLSRSLTSEMLIEHGLIPTLKEMISRINISGSIHADFQVFGITHPLPKHVEQNLFRIIQELVNNILKHAQATEFSVQCIQHEESIIVMVEDDGVGIESEVPGNSMKGMGFGNIRTRLNVLNGSIAVDSAPGRGTTVTLDIPFVRQNPTSDGHFRE